MKISFQIVPQTTPSAFLRYLLNLWPNINTNSNNRNSIDETMEESFRSPCTNRNSNTIITNRNTNTPTIPYKEILVIADTLLGLFWEGTTHRILTSLFHFILDIEFLISLP